MKILKIFGIVAGIHVFALILIFANPGCSSTTKPPPAPKDTVMQPGASPTITVPNSAYGAPAPAEPPITFNPDAPATAASSSSSTVRFTPTRPGTPVAGSLLAEPVADVTPVTTYKVVSGDNLWNLAKRHRLTVTELAAANNIGPNAVLRPGQKLIIPSQSSTPAASATTASFSPGTTEPARVPAAKAPADSLTHVVKAGETLGVIARRYGVKQGEIAVANNISDPQKIRAGMELIIPGRQSAAGKWGKSNGKAASEKAKPPGAGNGDTPAAFKTEIEPPAPKEMPATEVPVIRVDDSPISPSPKN